MRRFEEENGQYCLSFCREEEGCERCEEKSWEEIVSNEYEGQEWAGEEGEMGCSVTMCVSVQRCW